MALELSQIGSPGAHRNCAIDLSGAMQYGEVVTGTPTVVSDEPTILEVSAVSINDVIAMAEDGGPIAPYEGVLFHLETLLSHIGTITLRIFFEGDIGNAEPYKVRVPIVVDQES